MIMSKLFLVSVTKKLDHLNLHAWVLVVVERADAHPVPVHFNSIMLRSLPCGDGLLHGFKYVQ